MECIVGVVFSVGFVFWLAGGAEWLAQKTRALKLKNDELESKLTKENNRDNEEKESEN